MRVVLVGWDFDGRLASALTGLGVSVVAFSRAGPEALGPEQPQGWIWERMRQDETGNPRDAALAFRESTRARFASISGRAGNIDVVHALDAMAGPAALGIRDAAPGSVFVASISGGDSLRSLDSPGPPIADRWIADHPWTANRFGAGQGMKHRVWTVLPPVGADQPQVRARAGDEPLVAFWLERWASLDPDAVVSAVLRAREEYPTLAAVVLGSGPLAHILHRRLSARGLTDRSLTGPDDRSASSWSTWVANARALGIAGATLVDDPATRLAWEQSTPAFSLGSRDELADALLDTLRPAGRRRAVGSTEAIFASRMRTPEFVAEQWLRVYLDAINDPRPQSPTARSGAVMLGSRRSRLSLVALGPREIFAAWHVHRDDWRTALEWLGSEGVRATLSLRVHDVTDIEFHGSNAHGFRYVDVAPGESSRSVGFDSPGRSVVATLGARSPSGHFHALAHAGPTHMPRDNWAPDGPIRRLHVLPRRS
jgi:Domain of unknown function (DUF4912)